MTTEKTENVFKIHEINLGALSEKIDKLNKKAEKLNLPLIVVNTLEIVNEVDKKSKEVNTFHMVEIVGDAPKLNGWKFVAKLETIKDEKYNLVFVSPNESIPNHFRESGSHCEHCHSNRYRKYTYVLQHENGEYKQVGSSCLKDFLGHSNPNHYANYLEWLEELSAMAREGETVSTGSYTIRDYKMDLKFFVAYVAEYVKQIGYFVSSGKAWENGDTSTADSVWNELHNSMLKQSDKVVQQISDDSLSEAERVIEWGLSLTDRENLSDYLHNLNLSCKANVVDWKSKGIVASILTAYQYDLNMIEKKEKNQQEKESEKASEYFGEVGKRKEFVLTVIRKHGFSTQFGYTILHTFKDEAGNIATWFSSNKEFKEGETIIIKATVKEHKEYKGVKQTVLSRCTEVKKQKKAS